MIAHLRQICALCITRQLLRIITTVIGKNKLSITTRRSFTQPLLFRRSRLLISRYSSMARLRWNPNGNLQKLRGDWITIDTDRISHDESGHGVLHRFVKSIDKIENPVEFRESSLVSRSSRYLRSRCKVFHIVYEYSFWYIS